MANVPKLTEAIVAKPEGELVPGPDDEILTSDELQQLELFGSLKRRISVEKFPGSLVLRRFPAGHIVCRQGEPGHSAFYILTAGDLERLRSYQRGESGPVGGTAHPAPRAPVVAAAWIMPGSAPRVQPGSWLQRLARRTPPALPPSKPTFIPNDGPEDIDYRHRRAEMVEGDIFGEMSCMTLAPRSATVSAEQDCYMVEFLRNIFDQMQRDEGYRRRVDQIYEDRVLSRHLRRLGLLQEVSDEQLAALRPHVRLEIVEPGTVICEEGAPADNVCLIRSGVVQVVAGVNYTLTLDDVSDWPGLARAVLEGSSPEKSAGAPGESPSATPKAARPSALEVLAAARAAKAGKGTAAPAPPGQPSVPSDNATASPAPAPLPVKPLAAARASAPAAVEPDPAALVKSKPPATQGDARRWVGAWLESEAHRLLCRLADGTPEETAPGAASAGEARRRVLEALRQLSRKREFLAGADLVPIMHSPAVWETVRTFPKGLAGCRKDWTELEVLMAGRLVLQTLFDRAIAQRRPTGPPRVLAYLTRGDYFGEMAVVLHQPRAATCIAYDHPPDDTNRKPGRVELVKIDADAFRRLLESSPPLQAKVQALARQRQEARDRAVEQPAWQATQALLGLPEVQELGLVQGQKLLLIDLDLCTRCGDCVRACINTHDDGYSRLFLDGPRFDRFLVPSACRQCLNPACMIGCPVGSIQRGDNGQIEIRDWCIGCGLCARQCPYDSIQMHDLGLIPLQGAGWRYVPQSRAAARWQEARFADHRWEEQASPLRWTLDFQSALARSGGNDVWTPGAAELPEPICFRHRFDFDPRAVRRHVGFRLSLIAPGLEAEAWINGTVIPLQQDAKQKKKGEFEARLELEALRPGTNTLAVRVAPPAGQVCRPADLQEILALRLDPLPELGALAVAAAGFDVEVTQLRTELVTERAVVCDLCSDLPGQEPACVQQCPHQAARRIDARFELL